MPCMAWRWKKRSPEMPSGARTIELGRPLIWPIIHSPTAAKYCARSSLVTGFPSPASGHSGFSGFEITTPITSADLPFALAAPAPLVLIGLLLADAAVGFL